MKILSCHNRYLQTGGEDLSFEDEVKLLRKNGHDVIVYERHNREIDGLSSSNLFRKLFWNRETFNDLQEIIGDERPAVMHCTNTFPLISVSAYDAAEEFEIPVVQAFRNYRLFCANSVCVLNGKTCERCLKSKFSWPAVANKCYRDSHLASLAVAALQNYWKFKKPWKNKITLMYTLTEFARRKLVEFGLPAEKVVVKPNFVNPPMERGNGDGGYAVFVGRLSHEKGISTLLGAWREMQFPIKLIIIGDGPLNSEVEHACSVDERIVWKGRCDSEEVFETISDASMLVMPSIAYETFGRTIIEAFSVGTPVVGSNRGAIAEIVVQRKNGLLFSTGNSFELAKNVVALAEDVAFQRKLRDGAYASYLKRYTAKENYALLMSIYDMAITSKHGASKQSQLPQVDFQNI